MDILQLECLIRAECNVSEDGLHGVKDSSQEEDDISKKNGTVVTHPQTSCILF